MSKIAPSTLGSNLSSGLGCLVMWELSDTAIEPARLRGIFDSLGEDASIIPDIDPASAVARAAREWGQGRGNETRYRAEVVLREVDRIEVGVLERRRVAQNEVEWVQVDRVVIDTFTSNGVTTINAMRSVTTREEAKGLMSLIRTRATHLDADWIRPNLIQARLDAVGALNVRRQGGVMFVAHQHLDEVERLARIVRQIGTSSFDIVHVETTKESVATVQRAASSYMEEQINDVVAKLDDWAEKSRAPRSDAVAGLVEQVGDLVLRGGLYADVLQVAMEGINERLAAVKSRALALLMNGVEDAA